MGGLRNPVEILVVGGTTLRCGVLALCILFVLMSRLSTPWRGEFSERSAHDGSARRYRRGWTKGGRIRGGADRIGRWVVERSLAWLNPLSAVTNASRQGQERRAPTNPLMMPQRQEAHAAGRNDSATARQAWTCLQPVSNRARSGGGPNLSDRHCPHWRFKHFTLPKAEVARRHYCVEGSAKWEDL